jgi:hypothetical protein
MVYRMIRISNKYSIQEHKLIFEDSEIIFDFLIGDCLEIGDMLIVLLAIPVDRQYNENVLGVNLIDKQIKWQISKQQYIPAYNQQCPFVSIRIFQGEVRLNNWCSVYFIVDPITGTILRKGDSR